MMTKDKGGKDRGEELRKIIRPLRTARYEVDSQWEYFFNWMQKFGRDYGGLELDPDFQRGHVWTVDQQRRFIENVLRGVVSTSGFLIQFNCPNFDIDHSDYVVDLPLGLQCIDGLQRITAVRAFLNGDVLPFGLNVQDLDGTEFSMRRNFYRFHIAIHNFRSRADLLQHYLDLNTGGTVHAQSEIDRVAGLLEEARKNAN